MQDLISVYRALARRCDYALHLGLTEAGMGTKGTVASAVALARAAAGGHRRHDPRHADAAAGRVAHAGGGDRLRAVAFLSLVSASSTGMLNAKVFPEAVGVAITTFLPCLALFMASAW